MYFVLDAILFLRFAPEQIAPTGQFHPQNLYGGNIVRETTFSWGNCLGDYFLGGDFLWSFAFRISWSWLLQSDINQFLYKAIEEHK